MMAYAYGGAAGNDAQPHELAFKRDLRPMELWGQVKTMQPDVLSNDLGKTGRTGVRIKPWTTGNSGSP